MFRDDAVRVDIVFEDVYALINAGGKEKIEPGVGDGSDIPAVVAAISVFAEKYNLLQDILLSGLHGQCAKTSGFLREEVYRPVELKSSPNKRISLYEIGVAHSPDHITAGRLSINEEKLTVEFQKRRRDIEALFIKKEDGLLIRMNAALSSLSGLTVNKAERGAENLYKLLCSRINEFTDACEGLWELLGCE